MIGGEPELCCGLNLRAALKVRLVGERTQPTSIPTWALNNPSMQPENAITRPRGALLWFRTGFNVVVPQAFRLLNIATATQRSLRLRRAGGVGLPSPLDGHRLAAPAPSGVA
jgi:hypothetical protein